ncbi:uncharacterized protein [Porites lutea]|uniref:uncharacterized protein n=1 Tax=Porites lutea TaxID=51062 RepID=UPI003CC5B30B
MSADLGAIKRKLGPRKRHVNLNIQAAKEVKQRPIEGDLDLEQLLDDTREKRDQLQQHLTVYKSLRTQLEETAESIGKREYDKVMEDYDDYADLTLEAEQLVVGLSSRMEMIKDRMEFKLRRGSVKVNIELEEKMLEIERQKAEIEHRKLQIEAERLNLEKEKLKKKLEVETAKQGMKSNTVKLPKLDFNKFSGELLKWQEFWDSFESAIHSNASLNPVEKMNYLRAKLEGEAEEVISGLTLTNANYEEAISLLQKRFGQNEIIINAHYTSLMDMPASSSSTSALRTRYDSIEKHLRSLQALGEDVNTKMLVSLIMTKLPKDVITHLTDHKEDGQEWTVQLLRDKLHRFITNRENAERQCGIKDDSKHTARSMWLTSEDKEGKTTTETLFSVTKPPKDQKVRRRDICVYCQGKHWSDECKKYATVAARKEKIKGQCFICLKPGHHQKDCKANKVCVHCQQKNKHHRSLCINKFQEKPAETAHVVTETISPVTDNTLLASDEQVLMQTATVEVENLEKSGKQTIRLLLDTGSQRSYITEQLADKLQLPIKGSETLTVYTFNTSKPRQLQTPVTELRLLTKDGSSLHLRVNVVPKITGTLQRACFDTKKIEHLLKDITLADSIPTSKETASIELLLGSDYYCDIFFGDIQMKQVVPGLNLMASKLGWILTGRIKCQEAQSAPSISMLTYTSSPVSAHLAAQFNVQTLPAEQKPQLDDFWKLETLGISEPVSVNDDDQALQKFNDTVRFEDGRYQVTWPWKKESPSLPTNYQLALGRLRCLTNRLAKNPERLTKYDAVIQDQLHKGIVEIVPDEESVNTLKHYIPHHEIVTPEKTTTKIRIVFDASAKTKKGSQSLNENLHRGPIILEDLCGLLMRFRINRVALIADVEKAFHQVGLQPEDRDVTRFLWLKDATKPTLENNVQELRFTRVPFGMISSPFLLAATVKYHLNKADTPVAKKISDNMHVDNMVTGVATSEQAVEFYKEAKSLFQSSSMNLREWASNSKEFLQNIPESDQTRGDTMKILGTTWNMTSDTIFVNGSETSSCPVTSKREALQSISRIYDPLGFFSPVTLNGKLFLQELWKNELDWDETLSELQQQQWYKIQDDHTPLSSIPVPRYIGIGTENKLFCFTDASAKAYSAAVYLYSSVGRTANVNLVFSKARVAPTKQLSIPRLELLAVVIGTRCLNYVTEQLQLTVTDRVLWTDSQCVLHWMKSHKPLPVFVQNRLKEIKSHKDIKFRYVTTTQNPADLATRGVSAEALIDNQLWWHGPSWLSDDETKWPSWDFQQIDDNTLDQMAKQAGSPQIMYETPALIEMENKQEHSVKPVAPFELNEKNYSCLTRLLRVTAWALRFILKVKKKSTGKEELQAEEIEQAKLMWERHVQNSSFSSEINAVKKNTKNNLKDQLSLQLDQNGILRCHGRMIRENLPESSIFPKLLPKNHAFTSLLINSFHDKLMHAGVSHTLSAIRREFWIPQGRTTVRNVLLNCRRCRRHQGGPYKMPKMAPYPPSRIEESSPFTYTGLDYLGPLYVKVNGVTQKVWVCLFTCLAVRAVHLEVIHDLSAQQFVLCLRRFIARRGKPKEIISDNASQFKLAKSTVEEAWQFATTSPDTQSYLANEGITWSFIIELAPWMGGFYERLVGLVKQALRKSIGKICLNIVQLETILTEIEAVINSRPLVYVGADLKSGFALTPGDFLSLNPKTGVSFLETEDEQLQDPDFVEKLSSAKKLLETWKKGQKHLNTFWKLWFDEYVLSLRERSQKYLKAPRVQAKVQPTKGDVVLLKESSPRGTWKLAMIEEIITSKDNEVRAATIRTATGKLLNRPLNFLCPLECAEVKQESNECTEPRSSSEEQHDVPKQKSGIEPAEKRPLRRAAAEARRKLNRLLNT